MKKERLDVLLTEKNLCETRERAKTTIMAGLVYVNGQKVDKPGTAVDIESSIEVRGNAIPYVSRGGLKLEKALKIFPIFPEGKCCIDCGASTGGFTDVLLQNGARKVFAVDVGYGQLAWKLRTDERVVNMERTNVRHLTAEQLDETPELAVMDVSFISIRLLLPVVSSLISDNADIICLIKPQFEAGREKVGKKGVVRDPAVHLEVLNEMTAFFPSHELILTGIDYSPIRGPEGNIEYLCHLKKACTGLKPIEPDLSELVKKSHLAFGGT